MFAKLPDIIQDISLWMMFFVGVTVFLGALFKFVVLPFFATPIADWFEKRNLDPKLSPILEGQQEIKHLIQYHLGANHSTPPLRDRMLLVETNVANLGKDTTELKREIQILRDIHDK